MKAEIQAAIIAAITSTIITPLLQSFGAYFKRKREYEHKIAPIVEYVRVLHRELLQEPINPNIQGVMERILAIEQFHDPVFNNIEHYNIKMNFLREAKFLERRHKRSRPWMQIEYPEQCTIFGNTVERILAVLNKEKRLPELFDPSE